MATWKQESTPSLYGCAAKLKDNAADCKREPHHKRNKRLIKQMVLTNKAIYKAVFTVNAAPSTAMRIKYPIIKSYEVPKPVPKKQLIGTVKMIFFASNVRISANPD
ncbi:MAG: hypothetical protein M0Q44_06280 [Methylobacter sp.]|jgi:hypothetical protein|nr:hypothetical protein [Methylobacter sp.]